MIMKDVAQINHMNIIDVKFVTVEHGCTQDEAIEKFLNKNNHQFKNIIWKKERKIINKTSRMLDYYEEMLKMENNNDFPYKPLIDNYKKQIKYLRKLSWCDIE